MQLTEAATLHRKSGGAEGSAVPRIFPGNEEILCSNRIVISTGAQRSGEICGFFLGFSRRPDLNPCPSFRGYKKKGLPEGRPFFLMRLKGYWLTGTTAAVPEAESVVSFSAK